MLETLKFPGWLRASLAVSLGGLLNGYDTGSIGALISMPSFEETFGPLTPTIQGLVISSLLLVGSLPGFYAGRLAEHYGQLRVIMIGALTFMAGAVLQAASLNLPMLFIGRVLGGLGEGMFLSNVTIYVCEIAPRARRGTLMSITQFMVTVGICGGFFTCYGSIHIPSSLSWRLPFILQAVTSLLLAVSCFYLPMSPRWLYLRNRTDDAMRALERLQIPRAEAEKDILQPPSTSQQSTSRAGVLFIFRRPFLRRTALALFLMSMVQLSGIDGVLYYAPLLFTQAGLEAGTATFLASGVSAIAILAVSVPAFLLADRWGRRTSFVAGGVGMAACMFAMGGLYATQSVRADGGAGRWAVIVLIFAFALIYAATWAISSKIYASEIQAPQTRAAANSVAQGMNFLTNWLVALTTPIFLARSAFGAYFLFGSLTILTVAVCLLWMPETRGLSLEDIHQDALFRAPGHKLFKVMSGLRRRIVGGGRHKASSGPSEHELVESPGASAVSSRVLGTKTYEEEGGRSMRADGSV